MAKVVAIQVPDTVSTASFTLLSEATLSNSVDTISGTVIAKGQVPDPPTIAGIYKITPHIEEP